MEDDRPVTFLYAEKSSGILYEVQFFETFVLHKPATPEFADILRKVSYEEFEKDFEEFQGNVASARAAMAGYDEVGLFQHR